MELNKENLTVHMKLIPSLRETAAFFAVSEDTVSRRIKEWTGLTFKEFREKNMAPTKQALINKALELALEKNNVPMLKLCLEKYCGWDQKQDSRSEERVIQIVLDQDEINL